MEYPLRILPVGGVGKMGMNGMLVGHRDRWILVDCGVEWPEADDIGVERILPDLAFLESWRDRIEAVVLTHGHEDHLGALPWVLPLLDSVPVYATPFTRELARHRLGEHKLWREETVITFAPREPFKVGPFDVEAYRVTHSIPDCVMLALRTEDGTIVHTGDWKIDEDPMDGEEFDREGLAALGDEGVNLLLSDSTNASVPGWTTGERSVADALLKQIEGWDGRIIVAQFASNLHRLQGLVEAAEATGRRLVFAGRSLWRYLEAAQSAGRAPIDPGLVVKVENMKSLAARDTLLVCTGSQGEKRSALYQASIGRHPHIQVGKGDRLLYSARVIPGNEASAWNMINDLSLRGADIVMSREAGIHASGHARKDELAELIRLLKPGCFVPIHGEHTFLKDHQVIAREASVAQTHVIHNGEVLGIQAGSGPGEVLEAARVDWHNLERRYNDGGATGSHSEMKLSERKRLGWNGVVVVDLHLEETDRGYRELKQVNVETRAMYTGDGDLRADLERAVEQAVRGTEVGAPMDKLCENVSQAVRSRCRKRLSKRPEIIVIPHGGRAT